MSILETSACESFSVLATILFIKNILKILSYIVPAILILLLSIDIAKAVIANKEDDMKKAQNLAIKRIIAGIIVFFVPIIVDVSFNLIGDTGGSLKSCYDNATREVVSGLEEAEDQKLIEEEEDRKELIELIKKQNLTYKKAINKLRKESQKKKSSSSDSSTNGVQVLAIAKREHKAWKAASSSQHYNMILKYCNSCGEKSKYAWCAEFVNYSLIESGVSKKIGLNPFCSAVSIHKIAKSGKVKALTIHKAGGSYVPKPGDMIIFNWHDGGDSQDHIGLVNYVKKNTVHTIEGNYGDKVKKGKFSLKNNNIEEYISY